MTDIAFLNELFATIKDRQANAAPDASYVAKISAEGIARLAQKVGEEAVETVISAMQNDKEGLRYESADLLFHLMVLWAKAGLSLDDIVNELYGRQCKVKK